MQAPAAVRSGMTPEQAAAALQAALQRSATKVPALHAAAEQQRRLTASVALAKQAILLGLSPWRIMHGEGGGSSVGLTSSPPPPDAAGAAHYFPLSHANSSAGDGGQRGSLLVPAAADAGAQYAAGSDAQPTQAVASTSAAPGQQQPSLEQQPQRRPSVRFLSPVADSGSPQRQLADVQAWFMQRVGGVSSSAGDGKAPGARRPGSAGAGVVRGLTAKEQHKQGRQQALQALVKQLAGSYKQGGAEGQDVAALVERIKATARQQALEALELGPGAAAGAGISVGGSSNREGGISPGGSPGSVSRLQDGRRLPKSAHEQELEVMMAEIKSRMGAAGAGHGGARGHPRTPSPPGGRGGLPVPRLPKARKEKPVWDDRTTNVSLGAIPPRPLPALQIPAALRVSKKLKPAALRPASAPAAARTPLRGGPAPVTQAAYGWVPRQATRRQHGYGGGAPPPPPTIAHSAVQLVEQQVHEIMQSDAERRHWEKLQQMEERAVTLVSNLERVNARLERSERAVSPSVTRQGELLQQALQQLRRLEVEQDGIRQRWSGPSISFELPLPAAAADRPANASSSSSAAAAASAHDRRPMIIVRHDDPIAAPSRARASAHVTAAAAAAAAAPSSPPPPLPTDAILKHTLHNILKARQRFLSRQMARDGELVSAAMPEVSPVEVVEDVADLLLEELLLEAAREVGRFCDETAERVYDGEFSAGGAGTR